ncbi:alpha/beta hydrolase [Butyrivibrio sp. WCE2006]|uniref:alpha/beta hydrolase n=1 Tax=Butyrivibrio sp. WCE2006 TaxID=1410611 RepID=UPI000679D180|nr:alpha/beta hydrolase-fold protein [Butyrivibrio sp. WCE2006]
MKKKHLMLLMSLMCTGALLAGCGNSAPEETAKASAAEESVTEKTEEPAEPEVLEEKEEEAKEEKKEEETEEVKEEVIEEEEVAKADKPTDFAEGATVYESEESPTGYMVHFAYKNDNDDVASVSVTGPFLYLDPELDISDKSNCYTPYDYKNGFYASNCAPGPFSWGYTEEMKLNEDTGLYEAEFPITSGSFAYNYILKDANGEETPIDDPANPSPAKDNANSNFATGDLTHSIVYGKFDSDKQSKSLNLDYVLPNEGNHGELKYVEYKGVLSSDQDLGVYTPAGYDADREEPYKTVYMSHGGGGNETDWFAMGHVDNIIDNLGEDIIIVTMDNSSFEWDFDKIEDNVINYIIPYMEENYNVSKEAKDRAFCGLSMGCMTTFHMYYDHPDVFAYFGGFSGPDMSAIKDTEGIENATLFFTVGTCDIASEKVMPNEEGKQIKYENYVEYLKTATKENVIDGGYLYGSHDWFTWSQSFYRFMTEVAFK